MKDERTTDEANASGEQVAALRHEIELRDELIATVAHELRNPLTPVYMQLEQLRDQVQRSDAIERDWLQRQLDAMKCRIDRFLGAIDRVVDAWQVGEGGIELHESWCDLRDVVRSALADHDRALRLGGCCVELDQPCHAVEGCWDGSRLTQIIGNLVSNAARYGAGKPISIAITEPDDEHVSITVRDRGVGIADVDLPRIFHRCERGRSPAGARAGLGIGLYLVAELCKAMGVNVDVVSAVGQGSTFTVALPKVRPGRS